MQAVLQILWKLLLPGASPSAGCPHWLCPGDASAAAAPPSARPHSGVWSATTTAPQTGLAARSWPHPAAPGPGIAVGALPECTAVQDSLKHTPSSMTSVANQSSLRDLSRLAEIASDM